MPRPSTWDERYRERPASAEPATTLVQWADRLPLAGRALDIACGGGRNAVFLARRGLEVVGFDRSWPALEQGRALASANGARIAWLQADLSQVDFKDAAFDLVICFYYRDPRLYALFAQWLRSGGLLFCESFTREQLAFDSGPRNPAHLLESGEWLAAFGGWEILFFREEWQARGAATLVARKP